MGPMVSFSTRVVGRSACMVDAGFSTGFGSLRAGASLSRRYAEETGADRGTGGRSFFNAKVSKNPKKMGRVLWALIVSCFEVFATFALKRLVRSGRGRPCQRR